MRIPIPALPPMCGQPRESAHVKAGAEASKKRPTILIQPRLSEVHGRKMRLSWHRISLRTELVNGEVAKQVLSRKRAHVFLIQSNESQRRVQSQRLYPIRREREVYATLSLPCCLALIVSERVKCSMVAFENVTDQHRERIHLHSSQLTPPTKTSLQKIITHELSYPDRPSARPEPTSYQSVYITTSRFCVLTSFQYFGFAPEAAGALSGGCIS